MGERAIENRVRKIRELEAQKKLLEEQINSLKGEIKDDMLQKGIDECRTKNFIVRWKEIISNSFDSKRFRVENPKAYSSYLVSSRCKRFTIC